MTEVHCEVTDCPLNREGECSAQSVVIGRLGECIVGSKPVIGLTERGGS